MNGWALLGLLLIIYSVTVVFITVKKPENIWEMAKIKMFRKVLGEKGTEIFFYIFAAIAAVIGIWLLIK
jgi:hypothetical protein